VFSIKSPETIEGVLVLATLIEDEDEPDYPVKKIFYDQYH
jgi:hypothetical protein